MRTPGEIKCDLCGQVIVSVDHMIAIDVPLPKVLREQIRDAVGAQMPKGILSIIPLDTMIPKKWSLDCCGCVLGFLPMLPEAIIKDVQRTIAAKLAAKAAPDPDPVSDLFDL